jgi:hypothetical protein
MNEMSFKMEREVHVRLKGREFTETFSIQGFSKKNKEGDLDECWVCSCSFPLLFSQSTNICGEDPLNAFMNCLAFLRRLIQGHKSLGYEIWWIEEGDDGGLAETITES